MRSVVYPPVGVEKQQQQQQQQTDMGNRTGAINITGSDTTTSGSKKGARVSTKM
jgi:hypothetical protein